MKTTTSSTPSLEAWIKDYASENPRSPAARLFPDLVGPVARRMKLELSHNADDQDKLDWLIAFEKMYPSNFKTEYRGDIRRLTGAQKLDFANGNSNPVPPTRRQRP